MSRVVHFEILAEDPERASRFYQEAFGWQIASPPGPMAYWLVTTGPDSQPGINGGLMARRFQQAVINTIQVDSLDEALAKVESAGGKKVHGPNVLPGVGTHAYCTDTEGNVFGIIEPANTA